MDYLQSFYQNNIYTADDPDTVINKYLQAISVNFARALYDIRQLQNENYLSFTVVDELHTRGEGPFERLFQEAAYDIFRVGFVPTQAAVGTTAVFANFPSYPVTLQRQLVTEIIKPSSNDTNGTFNINTLTFNLSNKPVTRVDSITFTLTTVNQSYVYNISELGYQVLNSTFDQDFASSYLLLANNQVKLNEAILKDPLFSLDQIFNIVINYEYKGLGIEVDAASVNVYTTLESIREVLPPIINIFTLAHAPITDASNNPGAVGGVVFVDPNTNANTPHPAFLTEIPFSLSALPSSPGVYSIDYPNATVYVYGASTTNDGTGPSPPLASYFYKLTYVSEIDYVYDTDLLEIVALPLGNLVTNSGTVAFNYEQVLIPGTRRGSASKATGFLHEFCAKHGVPHRRPGKIVVAAHLDDTAKLEDLAANGRRNGVEGLELIDRAAIHAREPHVEGAAALSVPSTGIVSAEDLVKTLARMAVDRGAHILTHARVTSLTPRAGGIEAGVEIEAAEEGRASTHESVEANCVINCAGLYADEVASMLGLSGYRIYPVRGEYAEIVRAAHESRSWACLSPAASGRNESRRAFNAHCLG